MHGSYRSNSSCNACGFQINGFRYHCEIFKIFLHPECAISSKPTIKYEGHEHLLTLMDNVCNKGNCEAFGLDILGEFCARCVKCDINYHIQCGDPASLPPTIVYEHHEHPLVLTETLAEDDATLFYCHACEKERNPKHSFYYCAKCEYSTHVRCVITKVQLVERKKLKHFSHQHFLILQENGDVCCSACENFIQGASYGCDSCIYYLHQFCAALPKTLLHPYRQHHLPLQKPFVGIYRQCSACHKHGTGYMFSCVNCKFNLDVDCISLQRPSMKIESHEHAVTIFEKLHGSPKCICCNSASSNIIYLRCVRCNYTVHLWCAPLPKTIKHESHHHLLTLRDYLFDKAYDEEVCDICEETRDQEECVYHCAHCDFVAEFNCLLSKIMSCLKGEQGYDPLRAIDREMTDKVIKEVSSLQDIYDSLTEEEVMKINGIIEDIRKELENVGETLSQTGNKVDLYFSETSPCSDEALLQIMVNLKSTTLSMSFRDFNDEVVNAVGDYKVSRNLTPVLKKLIDKYGDVGANCALSQNIMTGFLVTLCGVLQSMRNTQIEDITDELMFNWWYYLKVVQRGGLEIYFAFNRLKRIVDARYRIDHAKRYEKSKLYRLHEDMAAATGVIDEQMAKLEELKKQARQVISTYNPEKSRKEAALVSDALELILTDAGARLF